MLPAPSQGGRWMHPLSCMHIMAEIIVPCNTKPLQGCSSRADFVTAYQIGSECNWLLLAKQSFGYGAQSYGRGNFTHGRAYGDIVKQPSLAFSSSENRSMSQFA